MIRNLWYALFRGTALDRAQLVIRRSPIWLRTGMVFIHVPKAAGTSVSEALYGRFLGHSRAADVKRWGSRAVRSLPMVAITRNPWDRLVSAYRFVTHGGGIGPNAGGVWRPRQYRIPEFETFERFVTDWLSRRDPRGLDLVFQPQWLFVCGTGGEILVDHLGRFEDLGATYTYLSSKLPGLPAIPRSNRSGDRIDYRTYYSPALVDLVGKIYADDVRLFGYDFEDGSPAVPSG
jgi:hypothetical protein